jgi:serine/threonine protein kinase
MILPEDTILENRYRIDGLLAHGGMGAIYRAFDTNLNIPVAIKENFFQTPERAAQFKQEALILARLRHSALPSVIHHFTSQGRQYLVMDYIEGEDLWAIITRRGEPLAEREALDYMVQVCQAVSYLHRQRPPIIHRDIKPQNIKITPDGRAVLVDFGIAKQLTGRGDQTKAGAQAATTGFSPPEQYSGAGTTTASDIYSLGATLYAILTKKSPPISLSLMAGNSKFETPKLLNPKLSVLTSKAVMQAMQVTPELRPKSVSEWQRQLEQISASLQPELEQSSPAPEGRLDPDSTVVGASVAPAIAAVPFWLVDPRGTGYPVQEGPPLRIGRHSQADIVIEDMNVSRFHAQVKVEGHRCLVVDENSANGTFLNGEPLGQDWQSLNQGDVLIIGPARFYLTTTRPVKVAARHLSPSRQMDEPPVQQVVQSSVATDQMNQTTPEAQGKSRKILVSVAIITVALMLVGLLLGGYFWLIPDRLASLNNVINRATPTATVDMAVVIARETSTVQAIVNATAAAEKTAVRETQIARTPVATLGAAPTATPSATPTATTPLPTRTPTATRTASATHTPTPRPIRSNTANQKPTPIPLAFDESVPRLGRQEVIDVDINPKNPDEVYALVKRDGIYKSVNGGEGPWARMDLDGSAITALVIDPQTPTRLYAPTWNGVLKSTDGGNNWDVKTNGLMSNQVVDTLTIHPSQPDIIYAGIGETLVMSTDQGETWSSQEVGAGLGIARLYNIVPDPFQPDTLYVAGLAGSIFKSTDGGRNFFQLPVNVGKGTFGLAAHPSQPNVYLAGINSWDAGILMTENGTDFFSVSEGLIYGGADSAYSAITYSASNPNIVYAGSGYESEPDSKGIFKSTDGGTTWSRIDTGLAINKDTGYPFYVKSIAVHPDNPDIVFAATGSGLYKSSNGGKTWELQ